MNYNMNDFVVVNGKRYYAGGGEKPFDIDNLTKEERERLKQFMIEKKFNKDYAGSKVEQSRFIDGIKGLLADGQKFNSIDDLTNFYNAYEKHSGDRNYGRYTKSKDFKMNADGTISGINNDSSNRMWRDMVYKYGSDDDIDEFNKTIYNNVAEELNRNPDFWKRMVQDRGAGLYNNGDVFLYKHPEFGNMEFFTYENGPNRGNPKVLPGFYGKDYNVRTYYNWGNDKGLFKHSPNVNNSGDGYMINESVARDRMNGVIPQPQPAWQPYIYTEYDNSGNKIGYEVDNKQYDRVDNGNGPEQYREHKIEAYGGRTSRRLYAAGGSMGMIPMGEQEDYNMVGAGGSHEQNPMGGVPYGMNADGSQNMVEQGETSVGNQVYSDRSSLSPELCQQLGLPEGTSPSQAMQQIEALYEQGQISDEEYQEIQNIIFQDQEMQKQNSGASYQQGGVGGPGVPQNEGIQPDMVGAGGQQFAYGGFRGFRF